MSQNKKQADVGTPTADYIEMEAKRGLCRVLMVGTGRYESGDGGFLDNAEHLLPQYGSEHPDDYTFRRDHLTVVPPDFPDSVDAVVSSILSGPIVLEEAPVELWDQEAREGQWTDIDMQGRDGNSFIASAGTESIAEGLPWVCVDWYDPEDDPEEGERRTLAEASDSARPVWSLVHAKDTIEALHVDGKLVRARWREVVSPPTMVDDWDVKPIQRVRVTYRGDPKASPESPERYARFETWAKNQDGAWEPMVEPLYPGDKVSGTLWPPGGLADEYRREFTEIPLYGFYSGYKRPGVAWPPLRHQADLIRVWSLMHSDFASAQHYAMNPRDVVVGTDEQAYANYNPGNTAAGQGNITFLPRNASWSTVSHDGQSFAATQAFLDNLAEKIRVAGIETLRSPATGRELATLGLLERERKMTRLEVIGMFWQAALQACVRRHELLLGMEPKTQVSLPPPNKNLLVAPQAQLKLIEVAATHDKIDPETFWELAKDITGNDTIEPAEVTTRLAEYQRSMGPLG